MGAHFPSTHVIAGWGGRPCRHGVEMFSWVDPDFKIGKYNLQYFEAQFFVYFNWTFMCKVRAKFGINIKYYGAISISDGGGSS